MVAWHRMRPIYCHTFGTFSVSSASQMISRLGYVYLQTQAILKHAQASCTSLQKPNMTHVSFSKSIQALPSFFLNPSSDQCHLRFVLAMKIGNHG
jgi:hypothetical protein